MTDKLIPTKGNHQQLISLFVVLSILIMFSGCISHETSLTEDITDNGWVLFSSPTCSACDVQKEMFGEDVVSLNIVDCRESPELAGGNYIEYFPTWVNCVTCERRVGVQTVEELELMRNNKNNHAQPWWISKFR